MQSVQSLKSEKNHPYMVFGRDRSRDRSRDIGVEVDVERQKKEDVKRCRERGVEKLKLKKIVGPQNIND